MQTEESQVISILGHKIGINAIVNPQLRRIVRIRVKPQVDGILCQQYPDAEYSEYNEYQGEYSEYWE